MSILPVNPPPALEAPPDNVWRAFAMRGLRNQVVCAVVALLIWLMTTGMRGNLFTAWVYSTTIGTACWFFIDGSRLLLFQLLPQQGLAAGARRARWPGPQWMLVSILGGTVLGYTVGTSIGDAITGFETPSLIANRAAMVISLIAAVAATWYFYTQERLRQEQAETESARRAAAESQLRLLQSQLEPHMLFNTLANLRVLVTLDPPRAQAMLDRLIGYLRGTLGASRLDLHPLATEFAMLDDYLALMSLRMGPRLQVAMHLPDELRTLPVPPLLLQPLVENSIRHGLEPKVAGGRIEVRARRQGQRLLLSVRDTGVGLPPPGTGGSAASYGTGHVAERLQAQYSGRAGFQLRPADDAEGGTLAEVDLPWPDAALAPDPTPAVPAA